MAPLPSPLSGAERIRELNDSFRASPHGQQGMLVMTPAVSELPIEQLVALIEKVATFDAFTPDNDPHGEHDFGALDHNGVRYFWKIDYYDLELQMHSPDATDPAVTKRMLTLMRADEY